MVFNYTYPTNITSYNQIGTYLNQVSGDWFGVLFIASMFMIFTISLQSRRTPWSTNLMVSCWACFILSIFMWLMDWVKFPIMLIFLFGIVGAFFFPVKEKD